jgi:predicted O-methyltransferase YrrM
MQSSYSDNKYGMLFAALAEVQKPKIVVECGVLDGYSLNSLWMGCNSNCRLFGIDLFEDYEFKHCGFEEIKKKFGSYPGVSIIKKDAILAAVDFQDETVDILHIDISNDGDKLADMFKVWTPKITKGGLVIFEGGSKERDEIEWMKKYNKCPIKYLKGDLYSLGFEYVTLLPYPSITICRKSVK